MKKGQLSFYLYFLMVSILVLLLGAIIVPFGTHVSIDLYRGGELMWNLTQPSVDAIQDPAVRTAVNTAVSDAKSAATTNIEMTTDLYQYSWVFVIVIVALVMFLFTRRSVEYGGGVA